MKEHTIVIENRNTLEPKQFYRTIEKIFEDVDVLATSEKFAKAFLTRFFYHLAEPMGIDAVQLYERHSGSTTMVSAWGKLHPDLGVELEAKLYPFVELPWVGHIKERLVAVISLSGDTRFLMTFIAAREFGSRSDFHAYFSSSFSSIDYALSQHLKRLQLQDVFEQARAIQMSLLPAKSPEFSGFDVAATTIPAKQVGGDAYDFQALNSNTLAVTIADAAGHGLPAALQVRDVITGIRMGLASELGMKEMIQNLNRIIHQSGLVTRFVSMIFGLLSLDGDFIYINAGHPRPLLTVGRENCKELDSAGLILGPQPDFEYTSVGTYLPVGATIVLFTDGVIEHQRADGAEFGIERLKTWMMDWYGAPSSMAVQSLIRQLEEFGNGKPFSDDVTVLQISRVS